MESCIFITMRSSGVEFWRINGEAEEPDYLKKRVKHNEATALACSNVLINPPQQI